MKRGPLPARRPPGKRRALCRAFEPKWASCASVTTGPEKTQLGEPANLRITSLGASQLRPKVAGGPLWTSVLARLVSCSCSGLCPGHLDF